MPDAFRMWLDSLAPLAGSCKLNRARAMGTPAAATTRPHRQSWVYVTMAPKIRMPTVWAMGSAR